MPRAKLKEMQKFCIIKTLKTQARFFQAKTFIASKAGLMGYQPNIQAGISRNYLRTLRNPNNLESGGIHCGEILTIRFTLHLTPRNKIGRR
jgi:hypothetical protein